MTTNPKVACGAYGFNLGDWQGGQADYMMVPYADFQLLKFPDKDQAMAKIKDLTLLSDILPTGFHGCIEARVGPGSSVYIAGAGPVGRCAAASPPVGGILHHRGRLEQAAAGSGEEGRVRGRGHLQESAVAGSDRGHLRAARGGLRGGLRGVRKRMATARPRGRTPRP